MIPAIDWTISLGTLVHLIGLIIAGAVAWTKLSARLDRLEAQIETAPKIEDFRVVEARIRDMWMWWMGSMERRRTQE